MAGDWIKVESATPDKPELSVMADILGIDQDAVFGKLFRFWAWADQNIDIDGNDESNDDSVTVRVTKTLLDRITLCPGFTDAMAEVSWLVESQGTVTIPNFRRHNGKSAKNRAVTAKRVAKFKNSGNGKGNGEGNAKTVTNALPREEKRREEEKKKITPDGELFPDVPEQVIRDFRELRKKLRAPITETAIAGISREAKKAGMTLSAALTMCCERSWRGFKAEWVTGEKPADIGSRPKLKEL